MSSPWGTDARTDGRGEFNNVPLGKPNHLPQFASVWWDGPFKTFIACELAKANDLPPAKVKFLPLG